MVVVQTIATELIAFAPDHAALFQTNADAYLVQLQELDTWMRTEIDRIPADQRVLITAHDAFGYFGAQYGFEVHGIQGISTASEASASDIQELTDLIVERQVKALFVESSVPPATIEAVQAASRARGWEISVGAHLFSDAMGESGTFEGTYIGMVTWNVNAIVAALAGEPPATPAA
jgi:manganese/zinc/iron transport system substrate-binding protein